MVFGIAMYKCDVLRQVVNRSSSGVEGNSASRSHALS